MSDKNLDLNALNRNIDLNSIQEHELPQVEKILGKEALKHLEEKHNYSNLELNTKTRLVRKTYDALLTEPIFVADSQPSSISLLPNKESKGEFFESAIEAASAFYLRFVRFQTTELIKQKVRQNLKSKITQSTNYIRKSESKLNQVKANANYEEIGHLIMANLHAIPPRSQSVSLLNFYSNEEITIKLKETLTPQKNAEYYYRKAKNQKIEIQKIEENILNKKKTLTQLTKDLDLLESLEIAKEIKEKFINNLKGKIL